MARAVPKELHGVGPAEVRHYVGNVLGIQGDGVQDTTVLNPDDENLTSTVAVLRRYNEQYKLCSENTLANQWYLENKINIDDPKMRTQMQEVLQNGRLSQNQKIESQYDILKRKLTGDGATSEDKNKWEAIAKDKKEIDENFGTKVVAPNGNAESERIVVKRCKMPNIFMNCVERDSNEVSINYPKSMSDEINKENGTKIDFVSIGEYENGIGKYPSSTGYIPWDKDTQIHESNVRVSGGKISTNSSGVTVATGFDLGSKSEEELIGLGFGSELIKKLKPYLGLKKEKACNELAVNPMKIPLTPGEVAVIDKAMFSRMANSTKKEWNKRNPKTKFEELTPGRQTVLTSRTVQHGVGWMDYKNYASFLDAAKKDEWEKAKQFFTIPGYKSRTNDEQSKL